MRQIIHVSPEVKQNIIRDIKKLWNNDKTAGYIKKVIDKKYNIDIAIAQIITIDDNFLGK